MSHESPKPIDIEAVRSRYRATLASHVMPAAESKERSLEDVLPLCSELESLRVKLAAPSLEPGRGADADQLLRAAYALIGLPESDPETLEAKREWLASFDKYAAGEPGRAQAPEAGPGGLRMALIDLIQEGHNACTGDDVSAILDPWLEKNAHLLTPPPSPEAGAQETKPATGAYFVGHDHGRPGGDKSVEAIAQRNQDGTIEILSIRELPTAAPDSPSPAPAAASQFLSADSRAMIEHADAADVCTVNPDGSVTRTPAAPSTGVGLTSRMLEYLEDAPCECDKSTNHVCERCSLDRALRASQVTGVDPLDPIAIHDQLAAVRMDAVKVERIINDFEDDRSISWSDIHDAFYALRALRSSQGATDAKS